MEKSKKHFRLFDAVLACVCVILVVEAAAPSAAIGSSKYFWWIVAMIGFFLPYGLVTAELGTTYAKSGGLYGWISRAFGPRWGARAAYYYWIHFALWMAALAVLFTGVMGQGFGIVLGTWPTVIVQLGFIWVVGLLSLMPISQSKLIINACSVFKVLVMVALGGLGVYFGLTYGVANPVENPRELLPSVVGISFIAMVMFNFKGFEVVTTFASHMKNPQKQIPKALLMAGAMIVGFYLFASFGIGVAIPRNELSTYGGLLDSFGFFFTGLGAPGFLLAIVAALFMYSLFANPLVWAHGVNFVALHAAKNGAMPAVFAKTTPSGAPVGATIVSSVVASVLVLIAPLLSNPDIFWGFFALQILMLLIPYVIMFPAFYKLRQVDASRPRPFRAPGGKVVTWLLTASPMALLAVSGVLVAVYPNGDGGWTFEGLMIVGTVVSIIIGEIIVYVCCGAKKAAGVLPTVGVGLKAALPKKATIKTTVNPA